MLPDKNITEHQVALIKYKHKYGIGWMCLINQIYWVYRKVLWMQKWIYIQIEHAVFREMSWAHQVGWFDVKTRHSHSGRKCLCPLQTDSLQAQPDLTREKPVCRSGSNSQNWTWNNRLVPNRKRSMSRLYIVTLLI